MFKKIITILIITTSSVSAQEIRIHANTSYAFQNKFDSYYSSITYLSSQALSPGVKNRNFDLGINHLMIGGNTYFNAKEGIEPYLGGQLGITAQSSFVQFNMGGGLVYKLGNK